MTFQCTKIGEQVQLQSENQVADIKHYAWYVDPALPKGTGRPASLEHSESTEGLYCTHSVPEVTPYGAVCIVWILAENLWAALQRGLSKICLNRKLERPLKAFQIVRHCGITAPLCSAVCFIAICISCIENRSIRPLLEICSGIFVKPHSLSKMPSSFYSSLVAQQFENLLWHFDGTCFLWRQSLEQQFSFGFFCGPSQTQQADGRSLHPTRCRDF